MRTSAKSRRLQSQLGNHQKNHPEDEKGRERLRSAFGAARLEDYIVATLVTFGPLSESQRAELAELLRSGSRGAAEPAA